MELCVFVLILRKKKKKRRRKENNNYILKMILPSFICKNHHIITLVYRGTSGVNFTMLVKYSGSFNSENFAE